MQPFKAVRSRAQSAVASVQMRLALAYAMATNRSLAMSAYRNMAVQVAPVSSAVPGQSLIHRFGDHMSGVIYAGTVLVLGAIFAVESGEVVNYTSVDTIVSDLTSTYTTAAGLLILLVLAIIFGFALFYLNFAGGAGRNRNGGSRGRSRT